MNELASPTRAVAAAILALGLLLVSACSSAAGSAAVPRPVTMAYCGGGPQARPAVIEIVCGTTEIAAGSLHWSGWGQQVATAVGTAVVDTCSYEDCHTGSYQSVAIVMIASKIVRCPEQAHAYSRLQYVFVGGSPFAGLPANVTTSNDMAGPGRPLPPADQTVSLTC
jgi:hypothetical protein